MCGIKCSSLTIKKEVMLQRVPKKAHLFYIFEFESYERCTTKRDRKCVFQESNKCSSC
jgi:hypothetical protein